MTEQVLDAEGWKQEAKAVVSDIKGHVNNIEILSGTDQQIYLNLTTIERADYCVELSANGFRVVGKTYNHKDITSEQYFETPYSLLNHISPAFHKSFANELVHKLNSLSNS